jgi:NADPH:quinone reductase-like Zn-dependent oxidoreductase
MKAIIYTQYGSPDVLQFKEVEKPVPKSHEVLVKIQAASINSWDWDLLKGKPLLYRLLFGVFKPKYPILGADIAGRVEAVGKNVTQFQPGDDVFGDLSGGNWGGFAQYVCAPSQALATKSARMTFDEAAAVPQAAVLALQGLRDKGPIQKGQKVLIKGAGGGMGTFAIQMAKSFGAEVTGVDSTKKLDLMRSLGADYVIDYTREDFTKNGQRYDLILDVVAHRSMFDYQRVLSPNGHYVMVGGSLSRIFQLLFLRPWFTVAGSGKMSLLMHKLNQKDLDEITALFESGHVVPVIDRRYPLNEMP